MRRFLRAAAAPILAATLMSGVPETRARAREVTEVRTPAQDRFLAHRSQILKAIRSLAEARRALEKSRDYSDKSAERSLASINAAIAHLKDSRYLQPMPSAEENK